MNAGGGRNELLGAPQRRSVARDRNAKNLGSSILATACSVRSSIAFNLTKVSLVLSLRHHGKPPVQWCAL